MFVLLNTKARFQSAHPEPNCTPKFDIFSRKIQLEKEGTKEFMLVEKDTLNNFKCSV